MANTAHGLRNTDHTAFRSALPRWTALRAIVARAVPRFKAVCSDGLDFYSMAAIVGDDDHAVSAANVGDSRSTSQST
jgi:hypothetical protein